MTDTVSMESIKTILENKGYIVVFGPPDKAIENQVSINVDDIALEIETSTVYHLWTMLSLSISTSHPETIPLKVKTIVEDIEDGLYADVTLNRGSFSFYGIKHESPGELHKISLLCKYLDMIYITV